MDKKLKKSADRMIGGVCGVVAEYFDVDPTIVRVAYACLTVFSAGFPGVVLYLILCLIMPRNDQNYIK